MSLSAIEYNEIQAMKKKKISEFKPQTKDIISKVQAVIKDLFFEWDESPRDTYMYIVEESNLKDRYPNYENIIDAYFEHAAANSYHRPYFVIESAIDKIQTPEKSVEFYGKIYDFIGTKTPTIEELENYIEKEALAYVFDTVINWETIT